MFLFSIYLLLKTLLLTYVLWVEIRFGKRPWNPCGNQKNCKYLTIEFSWWIDRCVAKAEREKGNLSRSKKATMIQSNGLRQWYINFFHCWPKWFKFLPPKEGEKERGNDREMLGRNSYVWMKTRVPQVSAPDLQLANHMKWTKPLVSLIFGFLLFPSTPFNLPAQPFLSARASLYGPGRSGTLYVEQTGLELRMPLLPPPLGRALGLQPYITLACFIFDYLTYT